MMSGDREALRPTRRTRCKGNERHQSTHTSALCTASWSKQLDAVWQRKHAGERGRRLIWGQLSLLAFPVSSAYFCTFPTYYRQHKTPSMRLSAPSHIQSYLCHLPVLAKLSDLPGHSKYLLISSVIALILLHHQGQKSLYTKMHWRYANQDSTKAEENHNQQRQI